MDLLLFKRDPKFMNVVLSLLSEGARDFWWVLFQCHLKWLLKEVSEDKFQAPSLRFHPSYNFQRKLCWAQPVLETDPSSNSTCREKLVWHAHFHWPWGNFMQLSSLFSVVVPLVTPVMQWYTLMKSCLSAFLMQKRHKPAKSPGEYIRCSGVFLIILGSRVDLPSADFSAKLVSFDTAWTFSTEYLDNRTAV